MWYAVAPELANPPAPPAMVRQACSRQACSRRGPPAVAEPSLPAEKSSPPSSKIVPASGGDELSAGLPPAFTVPLSLPAQTVLSERRALRWICQRLSLHLHFHGPDYALYGAGVPFGKPTPAIELMQDLATIPYIQGTVTVRPHSVTVRNTPLR